jgi:signal transduction histidine kinase
MYRPSSVSSAAAAIAAPDASHVLLTRGPPSGNGAALSAELTRSRAEDRDRIAQNLNDIVVRRIYAAGLDLHAALGLMGDHHAADEIYQAIDELDLAIRDIRDIMFNRSPRD